jgi:hypothetical protein
MWPKPIVATTRPESSSSHGRFGDQSPSRSLRSYVSSRRESASMAMTTHSAIACS